MKRASRRQSVGKSGLVSQPTSRKEKEGKERRRPELAGAVGAGHCVLRLGGRKWRARSLMQQRRTHTRRRGGIIHPHLHACMIDRGENAHSHSSPFKPIHARTRHSRRLPPLGPRTDPVSVGRRRRRFARIRKHNKHMHMRVDRAASRARGQTERDNRCNRGPGRGRFTSAARQDELVNGRVG